MSENNELLLHSLELNNYRSWESLQVPSFGRCTVLIGENGVGKTNIVESLYLLGNLASYRTSELKSLLRAGQDKAHIQARVIIKNVPYNLSLELENNAITAHVNGNKVKPLKTITNYLPIVLFAPEDLRLIKGEPQFRRKYVDNLFIRPRYQSYLLEYQKIVKHKTALLKKLQGYNDDNLLVSLDIWDNKLIECASEIIAQRLQIIADINPLISDIYHQIAPHSSEAYLEYTKYKHCTDISEIQEVLHQDCQQARSMELRRGTCLYGPHRDDIVLPIGINNSRTSASHGESWSLALTLKIVQYMKYYNEGRIPLVILDDVFAELDSKRRAKLLDIIKNLPQIIITAAVQEDVPEELQDEIIYIAATLTDNVLSSFVVENS